MAIFHGYLRLLEGTVTLAARINWPASWLFWEAVGLMFTNPNVRSCGQENSPPRRFIPPKKYPFLRRFAMIFCVFQRVKLINCVGDGRWPHELYCAWHCMPPKPSMTSPCMMTQIVVGINFRETTPLNNKLRWCPQQPQRFIFTNLSEACCEAKRCKHLSWVSAS